jgi:hypothetical protein
MAAWAGPAPPMGPQTDGRRPPRRLRSITAMHARLAQLRAESGQTFVEWLGTMVVIVALVGLVIAVVPDVGKAIADKAKDIIDAISP